MLAAALAALLVGAPAASYDLSFRSETRRSRLDPAEAELEPADRTAEELSAVLGLVLDDRAWRLRLDYAPRLWTPRVRAHDPWSLDHRLAALAEIHPGRTWHLGLTGSATRGLLDPLADPWTDFASADVLPNDTPQPYESLRAGAELELRPGPRSQLTFTTSGIYSSGTTPEARYLLPQQRTVTGAFVAGYTVDSRDQFTLVAEGTLGRTFPDEGYDYESGFALGGLRWERDFSPTFTGTVTGGVSWIRETTERPGSEPIERWGRYAELGLTQRPDRSGVSSQLTISYAPDIDRVTGEVQETLGAFGTIGWMASPRWTWGAGVSGGAAEDGDPAGWGTEAWGLRGFENGLSLQVGFRYRWRRDTRTPQGSFDEMGMFLTVDWALARSRPPPVPAGGEADVP